MKRLAIASALLALAATAHAETVIFTTLNESDPTDLFDCCNALPLVGGYHGVHYAIPFDSPVDGRVVQIDLAISMDSGMLPHYDVRLYGSSMGLPGRSKRHFQAFNPPPSGQCCELTTVQIRDGRPGVPVHAGGHYWIEVNAQSNDIGGWNLNSLGLSGPYAYESKDGEWQMTSGPLPGVRVLVK